MSSFNYSNIKNIIKSASYSVINEFEYIDKLNVFPVPDGDTGTNLKMTLLGALDYLNPVEDLEQMLKDYSRGLLMNARGNSGAIFSQIIRGFSQTFVGVKGESVSDPHIVIKAFANAKEVGYKSVLAPVEGTILTVIRLTSEKLIANQSKYEKIEEVFYDAAIFAKEALDQTPKMLKILEEAKLVDSGGYGLWKFILGMSLWFEKKPVELNSQANNTSSKNGNEDVNTASDKEGIEQLGYCCEFIINLPTSKKEINFIPLLSKAFKHNSNSMVAIQDEDIVKVHLHSFNPGKILELGQKFGDFSKIKIDNMTYQAETHTIISEAISYKYRVKNKKEKKKDIRTKETAVIACVCSNKIGEYMVDKKMVDSYINQEDTGNPSTEIFINEFKKHNAKRIILITDNGNITMSAHSAAKIYEESKVSVIEAKTPYEAIISADKYVKSKKKINNIIRIKSAIKKVNTFMFSTSTKNLKTGNVIVKKDEPIVIHNKKIIGSAKQFLELFKKIKKDIFENTNKSSKAILIVGNDADEKEKELIIKTLMKTIGNKIEVIDGGQTIYTYILGVN